MKKRFRGRLLLILFLSLIAAIWAADYWVTSSTTHQLYSDIKTIPKNKVGLLLGTSKYISHGTLNPYYQSRINAAVALYMSGKIEYLLVSGDNSTEQYNEPERMKKDLVARGIPAGKIYTDYAGFRTLDSILRCREVFGQDQFTIISQPFHNERALFIANHKGLSAIAYNAASVTDASRVQMFFREKMARVRVLFDLALNVQPRYYGARIIIG